MHGEKVYDYICAAFIRAMTQKAGKTYSISEMVDHLFRLSGMKTYSLFAQKGGLKPQWLYQWRSGTRPQTGMSGKFVNGEYQRGRTAESLQRVADKLEIPLAIGSVPWTGGGQNNWGDLLLVCGPKEAGIPVGPHKYADRPDWAVPVGQVAEVFKASGYWADGAKRPMVADINEALGQGRNYVYRLMGGVDQVFVDADQLRQIGERLGATKKQMDAILNGHTK